MPNKLDLFNAGKVLTFAQLANDDLFEVLDTDAGGDRVITKAELESGFGGSVADASTTVKGIVEEADDIEIDAGTDTGGTGARLFVVPSKLKSLTNYTQVQFDTNIETTKRFEFIGNTTFIDIDFDTNVIASVAYSYQTDASKAAGGTPTAAANIAAINAFSESIGAGVGGSLIIAITPAVGYNGIATTHVKPIPKLT